MLRHVMFLFFYPTPARRSIACLFEFVASLPVPVPSSSAVFITGASTGIGQDAAIELAGKGYAVFAGVRKTTDGDALLAAARARYPATASLIQPIMIDVAKAETVSSAVMSVEAALKGPFAGRTLAAVVNNAGIAHVGSVETIPDPAVRISRVYFMNLRAFPICLVRCVPNLA